MDSSVYEVEKIVDDNYLNAECTRISRDAVVEEGRCLIAVGESILISTRPRKR